MNDITIFCQLVQSPKIPKLITSSQHITLGGVILTKTIEAEQFGQTELGGCACVLGKSKRSALVCWV